SNSSRKFRKHAFSGRFKKPFGLEFAFKRFELRLQSTQAVLLNNLNADLILPARFEDRNVSINLNVCPIGEWLAQRRHRVSKNDAGDLRTGIFEREILMTARV